MSKWHGKLECSICGHAADATAEVEEGQQEPFIPAACPICENQSFMPSDVMGEYEGEDDVS